MAKRTTTGWGRRKMLRFLRVRDFLCVFNQKDPDLLVSRVLRASIFISDLDGCTQMVCK